MNRPLLFFPLLALAAGAAGQTKPTPIGLRIHLGYGTTSDFRIDGHSDSSRGPEIGVAFPLGLAHRQEIFLEPSYFSGGRFFGSGSNDIDVYRLTLFVRHTLPRGLAIRGGVGYAVSHVQGGGSGGQSDVVFDLGLEVPFRLELVKSIDPYVDVHGVLSGEKQLSGFFVGLGVKV